MKNEYLQIFRANERDINFRYKNRRILTSKFSWAVPNSRALDTTLKYSPLVEIGAGTGYWAALLKDKGCKIICFDKYTKGNPYGHKVHWTNLHNGDENILNIISSKMNLFLCWPPYANPLASNCIKLFKRKFLIFIGEGPRGCTGDDEFFELLEDWELVEEVYIPQWYGIHDSLRIYIRA